MRVIALLAVVFLLSAPPAWSETNSGKRPTVTLVADEWCPFNCAPDADSPGILVDLARKALRMEGYRVEYQSMPWRRAIRGVRKGNFHGIIGTGPAETPDFHFPSQPLAIAHHSLFTLPDSSWTYTGPDSLASIRLGVIQEYSYGGLYNDYIEPHENDTERLMILSGNQVLPRLIQLLKMGRIDALAAEERVLDYHYERDGRINPLRHAGLAYHEELYVAFSPAREDGAKLAEALSRGMASLRQQGLPADIMSRYSPLHD